ncbi:hypothetical protein K1719_022754 [Acacia pycnantha]|nr:hypothetical protein K1719_022754 [Acacia pycnantha]
MALRVELSCLAFLISLLVSFAAMANSQECQYVVRVKTGDRRSAGTDSMISLKLMGSNGNSFAVNNLEGWGIMGPGHEYFERGNLDVFSGKATCVNVCAITVTSKGSEGEGHERRSTVKRVRGGDGDGDGKKKPTQSAHGVDEKGFAFGKKAEERRNGEGSLAGNTSNLKSNDPKLSYRDKLLSPGCARFLVKHAEEDDIMHGWKDYFHKMNEQEPHGDVEETDEEENETTRRMEGKPRKLCFTAEEYSTWCLPWMNSLIIKVLGANFPTYVIRDCINRMWRPKDALKLIPLSNGYYIVSFSNKEDWDYAFQEVPWMIEDHYLIVQRWHPNFNP